MTGTAAQDRLTSILRDLKRGVEKIYGQRLKRIVLYGSHARGDAREDSDVDILLILGDPVNPAEERARLSELILELCLEHDVVLSVLPIGESSYAAGKQPFLRNVRREGVVVT
ncbi:MAG: nucleotidyltransferase domain-containing protein [Desulfotomaculales bacterium]